jgi:hypothetical protein
MLRNKTVWGTVDKDQLSYESNFNPQNLYHNGPRLTTNPLADTPVTVQSSDFIDNSYDNDDD